MWDISSSWSSERTDVALCSHSALFVFPSTPPQPSSGWSCERIAARRYTVFHWSPFDSSHALTPTIGFINCTFIYCFIAFIYVQFLTLTAWTQACLFCCVILPRAPCSFENQVSADRSQTLQLVSIVFVFLVPYSWIAPKWLAFFFFCTAYVRLGVWGPVRMSGRECKQSALGYG